MRDFTANELTRMQGTQTDAMQDTCIVQTKTVTADAYGQPVKSWTDGSAIACGFDPTGGKERRYASVSTPSEATRVIDATVRLPLATAIDETCRVKITHRFGAALASPLIFGVVGFAQRGPSGLVVDLRQVEA